VEEEKQEDHQEASAAAAAAATARPPHRRRPSKKRMYETQMDTLLLLTPNRSLAAGCPSSQRQFFLFTLKVTLSFIFRGWGPSGHTSPLDGASYDSHSLPLLST
jgi:hypothetical protein